MKVEYRVTNFFADSMQMPNLVFYVLKKNSCLSKCPPQMVCNLKILKNELFWIETGAKMVLYETTWF